MSGWTKARDRIRGLHKAGTRVIVVEGEDDQFFLEALLDRVAPGSWPAKWTIGWAEGKPHVLPILQDQAHWFALVDRDEWTSGDIIAKQAEFPGRLHILPRYCMESYFILPAEVWGAMPSRQGALPGGLPALEAAVLSKRLQWLRHGCLWHAVNPLWDGLRALGFKDALLDLARAQDDAVIRQTLEDWHQYLDPAAIETAFLNNLAAAQAVSHQDQLTNWVHGKKFFEQHVVQSLNGLLGQDSADKWLTELRKDLPVPADLAFLWVAMGLP